MFSRPAKQAVRVGLLTAWLLLAACFPPALQPAPIAVEPTVTIAPFATPVPFMSGAVTAAQRSGEGTFSSDALSKE